MTPRLYIFDADNTLRRTLVAGQPCPRAAHEWALLPNVRRLLGAIPWGSAGPFLGVASNQDQVGYGHLSATTAAALLRDMIESAAGVLLPAPCIRFCPHRIEEPCDCRKPAPGMLLAIMDHFGVPPRETLFVGDAECDREAARRAGVTFSDAECFFGRQGRR